VVVRFLHAVSYALAVDAPEYLTDEGVVLQVTATLGGLHDAPTKLAGPVAELCANWQGGSGAAWADAAGRARRIRETRSALMRSTALPTAQLEPTVFVGAAIGEVIAELREAPVPGLDPAALQESAARLLGACLAAVKA
jgi:hypothetical protein